MTKKDHQIYIQNNREKVSVHMVMENETVWLTQEHMAELFGNIINEHIF